MTGEKDPNAEPQTIATIEEPSLAPLENSVEIKPEPGDPAVGAFPTVGIGASAGGLAALEQLALH